MDNSKVDEENQRNINDGDWICPDSQYVTFLEATLLYEISLMLQYFNFIHNREFTVVTKNTCISLYLSHINYSCQCTLHFVSFNSAFIRP